MAKGDNLYLSFHRAISSQALKNQSRTDSSPRDAADNRHRLQLQAGRGQCVSRGPVRFYPALYFETQPNSCPLAGESAPLPGFGGGVSG